MVINKGKEHSIKVDITIVKAEAKNIPFCVEILQNSELGRAYFSERAKAEAMLVNAMTEHAVYVALDATGVCVGFIYYMSKGVFGSYPYLHVVAVKEMYRGCGIGKQLIQYFEENASAYSSTKYFLTVDDFNPQARRLYETLGYQCVGTLPDFYKKGITCHLMMKEINR